MGFQQLLLSQVPQQAEQQKRNLISKLNLHSAGEQKIAVMKAVKEAPGLLKEAKDLVDGVPSVLKRIKKEEAEVLKKAIEEAGGKVELK